MNSQVVILLVVIAAIVVAAVIFLAARKRRSQNLREQFGPDLRSRGPERRRRP